MRRSTRRPPVIITGTARSKASSACSRSTTPARASVAGNSTRTRQRRSRTSKATPTRGAGVLNLTGRDGLPRPAGDPDDTAPRERYRLPPPAAPGTKQPRFRYLGALDLLLVAVFGPGVLTAGPVALLFVAGVGTTLAGTASALSLGPVTLTWRDLVGLSYGAFALVLPATYAPAVVAGTASGADLLVLAASGVGAASLAFYGVDVARGGRCLEAEQSVDRTSGS